MSDVTLRKATRRDFLHFFPGETKQSFLAVIGEQDGELLGIGGALWVRRWVAFMDIKEGYTPRARDLLRATRMGLGLLQEHTSKLVAVPDNSTTAPGFLKHYGFVPNEHGFFERHH